MWLKLLHEKSKQNCIWPAQCLASLIPYQGNVHRVSRASCESDAVQRMFFWKRSQWHNTLNPLNPSVSRSFSPQLMTASLWWICDGCLQLVWKWTASACSTSARDLRDDHTSCGVLHLCLHALFLLYLTEMLRASVSVVGRSVLSLLDVTVERFNSVPSLLFFFFFNNHSEGDCM